MPDPRRSAAILPLADQTLAQIHVKDVDRADKREGRATDIDIGTRADRLRKAHCVGFWQ
jgi:hypothetical protein